MTWLVWRRYRLTGGVALVALVALALWMAWQVHSFDTAQQSRACVLGIGDCSLRSNRFFSLNVEVTLANLILLALPCALGAAVGAPLVASELEHRTNRLVWTQGVSRSRWLLTKWGLLVVALGALVAVLTLVSQWWSGHVTESNLLLHVFPANRIGPGYFPVTGVVATAYTVFAFGLGTVVGAFVRRTGWAVFVTVVLYAAVAALMATVVRPNLAPQLFVPFPLQPSAADAGVAPSASPGPNLADSWDLGFQYRFAPGWQTNEARSAGAVAQACFNPSGSGLGSRSGSGLDVNGTTNYATSCLAHHHVQEGELYITSHHYWTLQWSESAILIGAAAVCLGGAVIAVRRWRA
jgi:ABC-type transport system involved in multi-copper enzyme maturation permease subunit